MIVNSFAPISIYIDYIEKYRQEACEKLLKSSYCRDSFTLYCTGSNFREQNKKTANISKKRRGKNFQRKHND